MSQDFLSQEEIDALLNKNSSTDPSEEKPEDVGTEELDDVQKDIMGEVGNISMSTAATTLSSILGHRVSITTPRVTTTTLKAIVEEAVVPKVVANVEFKEGLSGNNLMLVDVSDAIIIADLMMGGDGLNVEGKELSELELSAVAEAMNQMIGSSATAMATMLGKKTDILPPQVSLWDNAEDKSLVDLDEETIVCRISFDFDVEGLISSKMMQVFQIDTAKEISSIMMGGMGSEEVVEPEPEPIPEPRSEPAPQPETYEAPKEKVIVQKPVFENLNPDKETNNAPRNLDLILDVPLEFSVVLGRTRKTIKDVLSFGNGSVIELEKLADEPLEILVNGKLIAEGEVVIINENFGIRITNILSKQQRLENLK